MNIKIPEGHTGFHFFIHNKDQMYFIKEDNAFGSYYQFLRMPRERGTRFLAKYNLERTFWKTLNTESERCDETESDPNTTKCITHYIEQSVGCSLGYHGTDPEMER